MTDLARVLEETFEQLLPDYVAAGLGAPGDIGALHGQIVDNIVSLPPAVAGHVLGLLEVITANLVERGVNPAAPIEAALLHRLVYGDEPPQ